MVRSRSAELMKHDVYDRSMTKANIIEVHVMRSGLIVFHFVIISKTSTSAFASPHMTRLPSALNDLQFFSSALIQSNS